eukprot:Rmarinus@m.17503
MHKLECKHDGPLDEIQLGDQVLNFDDTLMRIDFVSDLLHQGRIIEVLPSSQRQRRVSSPALFDGEGLSSSSPRQRRASMSDLSQEEAARRRTRDVVYRARSVIEAQRAVIDTLKKEKSVRRDPEDAQDSRLKSTVATQYSILDGGPSVTRIKFVPDGSVPSDGPAEPRPPPRLALAVDEEESDNDSATSSGQEAPSSPASSTGRGGGEDVGHGASDTGADGIGSREEGKKGEHAVEVRGREARGDDGRRGSGGSGGGGGGSRRGSEGSGSDSLGRGRAASAGDTVNRDESNKGVELQHSETILGKAPQDPMGSWSKSERKDTGGDEEEDKKKAISFEDKSDTTPGSPSPVRAGRPGMGKRQSVADLKARIAELDSEIATRRATISGSSTNLTASPGGSPTQSPQNRMAARRASVMVAKNFQAHGADVMMSNRAPTQASASAKSVSLKSLEAFLEEPRVLKLKKRGWWKKYDCQLDLKMYGPLRPMWKWADHDSKRKAKGKVVPLAGFVDVKHMEKLTRNKARTSLFIHGTDEMQVNAYGYVKDNKIEMRSDDTDEINLLHAAFTVYWTVLAFNRCGGKADTLSVSELIDLTNPAATPLLHMLGAHLVPTN